ncbi:GGDEF domain-containing protein [Thalassobacillus pellis]|uniref:GGDEF domain-containing protein n=1 Tax=Thalassobacillus pellis TaxID=748008 RepID=UPI00195F907B|nr:GGDEF domain-containing protein [Thalassobacillus pellis]MBM7553388.1 diguanylate cyclase [Thalassobacillus pellis]
MLLLLKDLIGNAAVMIAGFYILGKLIKEPVSLNSSIREKVRAGYMTGLIGLLLMIFSIDATGNVLIDLRHIPIIIIAYYGGIAPTVVATLVIAGSRFLFGINETSLMSFVFIFLIAFAMIIIVRYLRGKNLQTILIMNVVSMGIITTFLYISIPDIGLFREIIGFFWMISIPSGLLTYGFFRDVQHSKKMFLQFKNDSKTDYLTGLANVRQFYSTLNEWIISANQQHRDISLLLIDIDHFKQVNDTYGHDCGDVVLKQLSNIIQINARPTDKVFRNGGEEFSILLDNCIPSHALEIAERLRKAVENHFFLLPDGRKITISVSIGASSLSEQTATVDAVFKQADDALYQAKSLGRNRVFSI